MKAIVQDRYGSPDVLAFAEADPPVPGPGQVLVRVRAAAVNAYDWHMLRGDPYVMRFSSGLRRPDARIPGRDFAGQVEAVGSDVTGLRPGDDVYGEANGAFAEYLCVKEASIERMPANLSYSQAAAIPLAANTALIGVRDLGKVGPGQRVLINGASGGVGPFAVQLAKAYGAEVTAVCSTRNVDLIRSLGADHIVDYTREDFTRAGSRYDLVLDLVGNRSLTALRRALTPTGTLVLSGGGVYRGGGLLGPIRLIARAAVVGRFVRRQRLLLLTAVPSRANLAVLRDFAESGALTPIIDRTYPLSEAAAAIRYLETEHARAKVVLMV